MRLLTINIHSHGSDFEPELYHQKMKALAAFMKEEIDAAAIQECSEEEDRPVVSGPLPMHWVPAGPDSRVREDNCALVLAEELQGLQQEYWWTWTGAKLGYGKYNEGLAIFSRRPVTGADSFYISGVRDFSNWKTRKALAACTADGPAFLSVHMGWWNDPEENFRGQMERLQKALRERKLRPQDGSDSFLMGDFNSPAAIRGEGRDMVLDLGWRDSYEDAEIKDSGITVPGNIDGWRDGEHTGMRLDYIWTAKRHRVLQSKVVLNGISGPVLSDHFGVLAVIE